VKRLLIIAVLIFAMIVGLMGCGNGSSNDSDQVSTFEKIKEQGYVTVGFANEAPYAYATPDGKLTGLNVEIAREVFKNMGIPEMNPVLTEFGSLIPGLNAGRFDVITAGMYITPERAEEADFADPEYQISGALAVKAGNPLDLHSYEDIAANSEVKVATMAGGQEYDWLLAAGVSEDQIETVPDQPSVISALQAGRVDCGTMTGPAMDTLIENANDPSIERVGDFEISVIDGKKQAGYGSAAFRKEDDDLREAYNAELKKLKESGRVAEIHKEFGFTESEYAGPDVTFEDALNVW
jgi:polar amino acid transport system substrate-binding protein